MLTCSLCLPSQAVSPSTAQSQLIDSSYSPTGQMQAVHFTEHIGNISVNHDEVVRRTVLYCGVPWQGCRVSDRRLAYARSFCPDPSLSQIAQSDRGGTENHKISGTLPIAAWNDKGFVCSLDHVNSNL